MRNILTFISLILALTQLKAQHFYQINAGMGVYQKEYNYHVLRKYNYSTRFGLNFGKQFSKRWTAKIGVNFLTHHLEEYEINGFCNVGAPTTTNYYTFAEFPLSLQYEVFQKKKFSLFISSGLSFNNLVYSKSVSSTFKTQGFSLNFDYDIFANAGFGIQYKFNENTKLFAQPNFNYHLYSVGSLLKSASNDMKLLAFDFGLIKQF